MATYYVYVICVYRYPVRVRDFFPLLVFFSFLSFFSLYMVFLATRSFIAVRRGCSFSLYIISLYIKLEHTYIRALAHRFLTDI